MSNLVRRLGSFAQAASFFRQRAAMVIPIGKLAIGATANILFETTRNTYGDRTLPDLAESTQDQREALGFSRNQPLLRDGRLLRDSVEMEVGPDFAAVGSPEAIAGYHEFGYFNVRANVAVPPRPVFLLALEKATPRIAKVLEAMVGTMLGFSITEAELPNTSQLALPGMASVNTSHTMNVEGV